MEKHRVRTSPSTDGNPAPHRFVELEEDRWLEVKTDPTHHQIDKHLEGERITKSFDICFAESAFHRGIINNWHDAGEIA
jgi:hypothetical protein